MIPFIVRTVTTDFHHLDLIWNDQCRFTHWCFGCCKVRTDHFTAAIKANQGEVYNYPLTIKFIK